MTHVAYVTDGQLVTDGRILECLRHTVQCRTSKWLSSGNFLLNRSIWTRLLSRTADQPSPKCHLLIPTNGLNSFLAFYFERLLLRAQKEPHAWTHRGISSEVEIWAPLVRTNPSTSPIYMLTRPTLPVRTWTFRTNAMIHPHPQPIF